MEKNQQKTPGTECCTENPAFRCSCSNCDLNECLQNPTQPSHKSNQELPKQYHASVTMADQTTYDDPVIQQVLKYVASIHSKLSKHSVAQKVGGNPNDWQYVIVKGKEGTKFICKRASHKCLNVTQKAIPAHCKEGEIPTVRNIQMSQDTHINKNLAYIFAKCSVPTGKSCSSICTECKNDIQNQPKLIPKASDICSECQKFDEMYNNQFGPYFSKYPKQEHINNEYNRTLNKMGGMYDNFCEECQSTVQPRAKVTPRDSDLCTVCRFSTNDYCLPLLQMKSVIPEVCAECRSLLNGNELYSHSSKKHHNPNLAQSAELCPDCKTALNLEGICNQYSFLSVQSKSAETGLCEECQREVNVKKGKCGYGFYQSNIVSKEACIGNQSCDLKGECPFCYEYLGGKLETYMDQKDYDECLNGGNKFTYNEEGKTPQVDPTGGTNCNTNQQTTSSQGACNKCESDMDPVGLYQTCIAGINGSNIARTDILNAIIQAYQACSCKVCKCFSSNSDSIPPDTPCQCKPCECPDCTQMAMKRSGFVFTTFPCFVQNDNCTCKPCDCIKCTKAMTTTADCECQPCQCIMCKKVQKLKDANIVLDQDNDNVTRSECACSPCRCTSCRKSAIIPAQRSRHEVSTDTATFRHSDCLCDDCVTETCQSLSTDNCLCAGKNKVMKKPFGRISNDFDIRMATVRTSNAMKKKNKESYASLRHTNQFLGSTSSGINRDPHLNSTYNNLIKKPQVKPKESHFISSEYEYNEIEQNLLNSQKMFAPKKSGYNLQSKISTNQEMCGLTFASRSQYSVESSSNIAAQLLDISNHQLGNSIGKKLNNVNITLYANTYSNPLRNFHNKTHISEKKSSSSQVTHTSSYTNDIPTKDEDDSSEIGCVREIKTRTRTQNNLVNNLEEEYHVPIYKTKKTSQTFNPTSLNTKKSYDFKNHTSTYSYIPKETSSEFNKSSTSTNISQSKAHNVKLKESKSTQDHLKVMIYKNGKNNKNNIKKCLTDAETHISSTSLLMPYNTMETIVSSQNEINSLHGSAHNIASVSNIGETSKYFNDVELIEEYNAQLTGMYRFPDSNVNQFEPKTKWIKENDSILKRIDSESGAEHSDSASHQNEEYRKDRLNFNVVRAFSERLLNILDMFEAINEELQTISTKINVFNGKIVHDLYKVRETIQNNEFWIPNKMTYQFPISQQYFTTTDRQDEIAVYNPDNAKKTTHEDIKLKHVSFNNISNRQTVVRTYTNEQYEELSKKTNPDSLTDIPVFEDDYAQFVVYNLDSKTVDVIDVDNHVTVGEIPFKKEKDDLEFNLNPNSIINKDNSYNDLNRCDISGDNDSMHEVIVESEMLKGKDDETLDQLEFDKSDEILIHEKRSLQRQKSYLDIKNSTLKEKSEQMIAASPTKDTLFSIVQLKANELGDLQNLLSAEENKDSDIMPPNIRQPSLQIGKNQLTINYPADTMENNIAMKDEIHVQTSERQFELKDEQISCSYRNYLDIFSHKSKEKILVGDSKISFYGTGSRDLLDMPISPGKITCEYLKVSDLDVRKISNNSVVVKWKKPMAYNQVCGYELLVDGKAVNKSLGPSECMAIVRCLPELNKLLITVKTMPKKFQELDHHPSRTVVFVRE